MKSQIKTIALSTMFSIIGLCSTLSTASAEPNIAQIDQDLPLATYMFAFPKLTSEGGTKEKPLLTPDNNVKEFQACKSVTKNEYFELAAIFNDKLQQLISSFSSGKLKNSQDRQLGQVAKIN
jgi:hypothetical protein